MATLDSYGWPTRIGIVTSVGVWMTAVLWLMKRVVQQSEWFSILFLGLCMGTQLVQNRILADKLNQARDQRGHTELQLNENRKQQKRRWRTRRKVISSSSSAEAPSAFQGACPPLPTETAESETRRPTHSARFPRRPPSEKGDGGST